MVRVVLLWQETAVTVNQARVWHPRPRLDDTIVLSGTLSGLMIAPSPAQTAPVPRSPDCEAGVPGRGRVWHEELTSSPPGLDAVPPAVRPLPGGSQTLLQRPARG